MRYETLAEQPRDSLGTEDCASQGFRDLVDDADPLGPEFLGADGRRMMGPAAEQNRSAAEPVSDVERSGRRGALGEDDALGRRLVRELAGRRGGGRPSEQQ